MKAQKTVLAWHFVKDDGTNRDGIKEKIGQWYKVEGEIVPCQRGLHGSVRPLDALEFAPGLILRRTEHRGTIVEHNDDKIASSERRALWQIDATKLLHLFACWAAENALKDAKVTDERCWKAIKIKRQWLGKKATDEELAAASAAASAAARDAARAAARAARRQGRRQCRRQGRRLGRRQGRRQGRRLGRRQCRRQCRRLGRRQCRRQGEDE